jgi:cullin-associated NEDD8-dissociated protein 1
VNQLLEGIAATDEEQREISCLGELKSVLRTTRADVLALKSVVADMPMDGEHIVPHIDSINKKILSVLTQVSYVGAVEEHKLMTQPDPNAQLASELLQILTDIYTTYPSLSTRSSIQNPAIESLLQVLDSARPSLRKRAIPAVTALVATNPALFDKQVKGKIVEGLSKGGEGARIWIGLIASLAKGQSVGKIGGLVGEGKLTGMILDQASEPTEVEAVEGSLAVSF